MTDTTPPKKTEFSGPLIQRLRKERHLSKPAVYIMTGIPVPTLKSWELGDRKPGPDGLLKLSEFYGLDFYRSDLETK